MDLNPKTSDNLNSDQNSSKNQIKYQNLISEESNIIAITACLKRCSVAIKYKSKIFERNEDVDVPTYLAFILENLIKDNDIDLKKIDGIITAAGPGSFTGIRTAQSLSKAIALTLGIPAASVAYFDVIEHLSEGYSIVSDSSSHSKNREKILVIKSEKNQAYYREEVGKGRGEIKEGVTDFKDLIEKTKKESSILVGEDIPEISREIPEREYIKINNFRMAANFLGFYQRISPTSLIKPLYLNTLNFKCSR